MRIAFSIILLLLSVIQINAQNGLGHTEEEIYKKFEKIPDKTTFNHENNILTLVYENEESYVWLYNIDLTSGTCYQSVMYPKNKQATYAAIDFLNEEYHVIDDKTWKSYGADFIAKCTLAQTTSGKLYFSWEIWEFYD